MSTQQQIDDPRQWRAGDMFEGEYDGHPFSGPIWVDEVGQMLVGATYVRGRDGVIESDVTGHVTRTVEPIPEPTVPWALVRFEAGHTLFRDVTWVHVTGSDADRYTWDRAVAVFGAPVAVSLPHWSDEVDGPGIETVRKSADEWWSLYGEELAAHKALRSSLLDLASGFDADAYDIAYSRHPRARALATAHAHNLRALLAEGGEA